jgi:flagellar motor switch protein FliN/FliY
MHDEIEFTDLEHAPAAPREADLARVANVPVELAVEIGRSRMTIAETLGLGPGSIVTLTRLAGEPVDLLVNGKPIARGEVVVIDEEFGLRITEVVSSSRRLDAATGGELEATPHGTPVEAAAAAPVAEAPVADAPAPAPAPEPAPDVPVEALDAQPAPDA